MSGHAPRARGSRQPHAGKPTVAPEAGPGYTERGREWGGHRLPAVAPVAFRALLARMSLSGRSRESSQVMARQGRDGDPAAYVLEAGRGTDHRLGCPAGRDPHGDGVGGMPKVRAARFR